MIHGFEPMALDEVKPGCRDCKWHTAETIAEFLESDEACIGKDFGPDAKKAYMAFKNYLMRRSLPVKVFKRGSIVGFVRAEQWKN